MKNHLIIIVLTTAIISGCSPQASCDSKEVKSQLSELAMKDIRLVASDIVTYSIQTKNANDEFEKSIGPAREDYMVRGINTTELQEKIELDYHNKMKSIQESVFSSVKLSLENIITEYTDEKTGFVRCKADFRGESPGHGWVVKRGIPYQIEKTSDGNLIVTATY